MNRDELADDKQVVLLDGATGTELERRGFAARLPFWSGWALLEARELLTRIHADYVDAGAQVITANTFRTNPYTVRKAGIRQGASELTEVAVGLARDAARLGKNVLVAGSVAPVEDCFHPELSPGAEVVTEDFEEHSENLVRAGVDMLLVETMNSGVEAGIAVRACKKHKLPVLASFILRDGRTVLDGSALQASVEDVASMRPWAVLVNCSAPEHCLDALRCLERTGFRFGCYPNAGRLGKVSGWDFDSAPSPLEFAQVMKRCVQAGAAVIGGCCGTGPDHIRELARMLGRTR